MVSENNPEGQSGDVEEPIKYEDIKIEEPERVVEYEPTKSVSEAEEETQQKTDLQAVLKFLVPQYKDPRLNEILQSAMPSRIFPDNILDKNYLIVMSLIEEKATMGEDVDIVALISMVQDALSKGYEGRHVIDLLEIAGVIHEEEMEKLTKELGL